jgi:hypothetical protein
LIDTAIAYLVALSLPLWLVVEELLHRRERGMAVDVARKTSRADTTMTSRPSAGEAQRPARRTQPAT